MPAPVSVFILTFNSENDIESSLQSVAGWADEVFIVDSFSSDQTVKIAEKYTKNIYFNKFENYAIQRNWALANLPLRNEWVLHLDADESLTAELREEISNLIPHNTGGMDGFYIKRRFLFLGKWLRFGGNYPQTELRLWRRSLVRVIDAGALEYIAIRGKVSTLKNDMIHENRRGISAWITKVNLVSDWEAEEILTGVGAARLKAAGESEYVELGKTRWLRVHIWNKMPLFVRPALLFILRYIVRLGFLDGTAGFIYSCLMHYWYHFLVSTKIKEKQLLMKASEKKP